MMMECIVKFKVTVQHFRSFFSGWQKTLCAKSSSWSSCSYGTVSMLYARYHSLVSSYTGLSCQIHNSRDGYETSMAATETRPRR